MVYALLQRLPRHSNPIKLNMKSEVKEKRLDESQEYPCIKQFYWLENGGVIVLFDKKGSGVVIGSQTALDPIGTYRCNWSERAFKDFHGTVTLSN